MTIVKLIWLSPDLDKIFAVLNITYHRYHVPDLHTKIINVNETVVTKTGADVRTKLP